MATLDTTRLIQPALTPPPTTTLQSKPAEGFQRLLDDETTKVSNAAAAPNPSRPLPSLHARPRSLSRNGPAARLGSSKTQRMLGKPVKAEAGPGGPRTDAPAKSVQRKSAVRDSKPEATDGSAELEAESATRQNLPSEAAQENSEAVRGDCPKRKRSRWLKWRIQRHWRRSASTAALLASLLVQTTGDLKGTQVAIEVQPQASEVSVAIECPASPAIAPIATPSTDTAALDEFGHADLA